METRPPFSIFATSFAGGPRPRNAALILGTLWLLLFFAALFAPPILDDADATHAQAAQAMARTGDLVTLHVDGVRYLEKAPLPYWLVALSFKLFGFNTFAAHFPQALAVLLLALLGHRWANHAFGSRTAFYTALAVLTSFGVFLFTRILIPEVWLSLFLASALYTFLRTLEPLPAGMPREGDTAGEIAVGEVAPTPERPASIFPLTPAAYPYLTAVSLALAVLSKGLVALVFFLAATVVYLALVDELFRRETWRKLRPFTAALLFLAIAAPWHILAALRNPATTQHQGFLWFYFWNEHVLRFLGRRTPADFNKLPGYLFWLQHLLWLFPWTLFLPLGMTAISRREQHQNRVLTVAAGKSSRMDIVVAAILGAVIGAVCRPGPITFGVAFAAVFTPLSIALRRRRVGLTPSPFHRIDPQQRTILLLSLFAAIVLLFFSLSTNQEYYTFPAYLPMLLLLAATITRAEQTYASAPESRRWITFAHAAFLALGLVAALALAAGLFASRHIAYTRDIGTLLAHRGFGAYTLSTSHLFDLTAPAFAALRLPAVLAALALAFGPALAWQLRMQRRHLAATACIAFTAAAFLLSAQIAFSRFAPLLSSRDFAAEIAAVERHDPQTRTALFGDQAFGSSIPFYLGHPVLLVDGRSTSMLFGSTFADAPPLFLTPAELQARWAQPARLLLFVPAERRDDALRLLPTHTTLRDESGKLLLSNQPQP